MGLVCDSSSLDQTVFSRLSNFDKNSTRKSISAVVITRALDVMLCTKMCQKDTDIYSLYMPQHHPNRKPPGSAMLCSTNVGMMSRFIYDRLIANRGFLPDNANLMSGHFFVPTEEDFPETPLARKVLLDATLAQLSLLATISENEAAHAAALREKDQVAEREAEAFRVGAQQSQDLVENMKLEIDALRRECDHLRIFHSCPSRNPSHRLSLRRFSNARFVWTSTRKPTSPWWSLAVMGLDENVFGSSSSPRSSSVFIPSFALSASPINSVIRAAMTVGKGMEVSP